MTIKAGVKLIKQSSGGAAGGDKTLPLPHNLYDYCSIRISSLVEKYLVVKRKISFVDKADILLTKLIIRGGVVIISTPLMWKGFYWDFDHIKPYHPVGLNMVFGNNDAQVQYYSNVNLKLKDIWFGRIPYRTHYHRGLYVKSLTSYWWRIVNWCYAILFKISFGIIGFYQNWIAVCIKEK